MVSNETTNPAPTSSGNTGWKLGMQALVQNRLDDALNELRPFVAAHPESFEGNHFLGMALARSGQYPAAIAHLQKAIKLNPKSARTFYNLGLAQLWSEDRPAARASFQKTLEIDGSHAQAQQSLIKMGQAENDTIVAPAAAAPAAASPAAASPVAASPPATRTSASGAAALQASQGFKPLPTQGAPIASRATNAPATTPASGLSSGGPAASDYKSDPLFDAPDSADTMKALGMGTLAGLACAGLFAAITHFTGYVFGYAGAGVGFAIGGAVVFGAGGKRGSGLQIMGALLTLCSLYLGGALALALLLMRGDPAENLPAMGFLPAFVVGIIAFPIAFATGGFGGIAGVLAFGFGLYQGWAIPSAGVTD